MMAPHQKNKENGFRKEKTKSTIKGYIHNSEKRRKKKTNTYLCGRMSRILLMSNDVGNAGYPATMAKHENHVGKKMEGED